MKIRLQFIMLVTFGPALVVIQGDPYCTPETPGPNDPTRPKFPVAYSTQIVGKMLHSKKMSVIKEYVDHAANKMAINIIRNGNHHMILLDTAKNTSQFSILGEYCWTKKSNDAASQVKDKSIEALGYIYDFNKDSAWVYKGQTKIRGVPVRHWRACETTLTKNGVMFDHYFKVKDNSPFRFEMKRAHDVKDKFDGDYHDIYDYFLYNPTPPSPHFFKHPPGMVCDDQLDTVPPLPTSAMYREQVIDPSKKTVQEVEIMFDYERQLLEEYESDGTVKVTDYSRGIKFTITPKGYCFRESLHEFSDGEQSWDNTAKGKGAVHMATMKHFFHYDGNFTYNGQYKARGILCDVYSRGATNAEALGASIIEIWAASSGTKTYSYWGTVSTYKPIVRVVIKGQKPGQAAIVMKQYEIYDFSAFTSLSWVDFDVSACFTEDKKIKFDMLMEGNHTARYMMARPFKTNLTQQISQYLNVEPLRVSLGRSMPGIGKVRVQGTLFSREDPIYAFERVASKAFPVQYKSDVSIVNTRNTPSVCAKACTAGKNGTLKRSQYCTYFTFNRKTKTCAFYFRWVYVNFHDGDYSQFNDIYERTSSRYYDYVSLDNAWYSLSRLVERGGLSYTDETTGDTLTAVSISKLDSIDVYAKELKGLDTPLKQFERIRSERKKRDYVYYETAVDLKDGISKDACARRCLSTIKFSCEAFRFTYSAQKCELYDKISFDGTDDSDKDKAASKSTPKEITDDIYLRRYASNFDVIPGQTILSTSDTVFSNLKDANGCAKLCLTNDDFYCQSFEMCGNTCLLGHKHVFDVPKSGIVKRQNCTHYSRLFIQDYSKEPHQKALSSSDAVVLTSIDIKQCAKMCSVSPDYNCDVFQYCDATSSCRISTKSGTTHLNYQDTGDCDMYSRKKARRRVAYYAGSFQPETSTDDGGHSPGSMGGIAIGMILVGAVLIIVIALVALKVKSTSRFGNITIAFSKKKLEEQED